MVIKDKNETLQPPEGYDPYDVTAQGSYLRLEYRQDLALGYRQTFVYLNDQGREVLRTTVWQRPPSKPPVPAGRWFRLKAAFQLALLGFEEMFKCLKK